MYFSLSTWNHLKPYGDRADLRTVLHGIRAGGFGAELWLDWTADPQAFDRSRWPEIKDLCSGSPRLSAHTRLVKYFSMETLCEEMDLCAYLGADPLVCHPRSLGLDVSTWAPRWDLRLSSEDKRRIGIILKEAAARSIRIALENGPPDLLIQVLEEMADHPAFGHLGICIDTGHAHMHSRLYESPILKFIRDFRKSLIHLHVHDNHGEEDEHLVPGTGTIAWVEVFEELAKYEYDGQIVFELGESNPEDTANRARSFVQDHLRRAVS